MKKLLYGICLLSIAATFFACKNEAELFPEEYHAVVLLKDSGEKEIDMSTMNSTHVYSLVVLKSGSEPTLTANATLKVMNESELTAYNEEMETNYFLAPSTVYTLSGTSLSFASNETSKTIDVTFQPANIEALEAGKTWVLPLVLESEEVNEEKNTIVLKLSAVAPKIIFASTEDTYSAASTDDSHSLLLKLEDLDQELEGVGCKIAVPADAADLVAAFATEKEATYQLLTTGYSIATEGAVSFAKGEFTASADIIFDKDKLPIYDCVLPLELTDSAPSGVKLTDQICYLIVSGTGINRAAWEVVFCNSDRKNSSPTSADGGGIEKILDGSYDTYWHSNYGGDDYGDGSGGGFVGLLKNGEQYTFVIDMKQSYKIAKVGLAQRIRPTNNNEANWFGWNQNTKKVVIYGAVEGADKLFPDKTNLNAYKGMWGTDSYEKMGEGELQKGEDYMLNGTMQWLNTTSTKSYRYLRVSVTERYNDGNKTVSLSELDIELAE